MKFVLVASLLFSAIILASCGSSEEVLGKIKSKYLKSYLKDKGVLDSTSSKLDEICPGSSGKLKTAIVAFQECDDKTDDSLTICASVEKYTVNCTKPLLDVVEECLPVSAKGLPNLGVKALLSVVDFLCKQPGESIFELFNPCLYEDDDDDSAEACEDKVAVTLKKYQDEIPGPADLCGAAGSWRTCVQTRLNKSCKNQKTKNVALGLYDAFVSPCSNINEVKTK